MGTGNVSAAASYLIGKNPADAVVQGQAAIHSYTTAFAWAADLFLAAALVIALLYRTRAAATVSLESLDTATDLA